MATGIVPFFISHQGCPHRCVFCDQRRISGGGERLPSADEIVGAVSAAREANGGRAVEVAFYGGSFTSLPMERQRGLLIPLQPLILAGQVASVRVSTRPDAVDGEGVRFLAGMGVRTVELGVQSMDDVVLARSGRGHTAEHAADGCRILKRGGLSVGIQLMPGLPGDTAARSLTSLDRVLTLGPDFLRIYPAVVIAGTVLADLYREGEYAPLRLSEAVDIGKIMLHRALSAGVRIVRMGLQATPELDAPGTVLAGPYHPAFRQLVEGELCYDLLVRLLGGVQEGEPVTVICAPSRISDVVGHKRRNLDRLSSEHRVTVAAVRGEKLLSPVELVVSQGGGMRKGNMIADLEYGGGEAI